MPMIRKASGEKHCAGLCLVLPGASMRPPCPCTHAAPCRPCSQSLVLSRSHAALRPPFSPRRYAAARRFSPWCPCPPLMRRCPHVAGPCRRPRPSRAAWPMQPWQPSRTSAGTSGRTNHAVRERSLTVLREGYVRGEGGDSKCRRSAEAGAVYCVGFGRLGPAFRTPHHGDPCLSLFTVCFIVCVLVFCVCCVVCGQVRWC